VLELIGDMTRFRGPVTSTLGVLAWPTSELDTASMVMTMVWAVIGAGGAYAAVRRDLPG
jgi:hypothetical protein